MSNQNILDEYLVKLGFTTDTVGYAKFANALRDASSLVNNEYLAMAKYVLEFQAAAAGMFVAVGAAAIGLVDKTAMADQEYRLLALHMFTSVPVARELKIALDALGQPLENVMWDPELAARFHQLVKDQQTLTQQLGPDFEKQMVKIRDVRFEFSRFGVELQYLTMNVVQDLARAFGTNLDGMLEKLRHFNAWFIANIPYFAYVISTKLKPILIDVEEVLAGTGNLIRQLGLDFIHFVGIMTGDKGLQNSKGGFEDMASAIEKTVTAVAHLIEGILKLETNLALLFDAAQQAATGNFSAAVADLKSMQTIGYTSMQTGAPAGVVPGAGAGGHTPTADIQKWIVEDAKNFSKVPPELALAVAQQESGFRQIDPKTGKILTSDKGALGIMQLMPRVASRLGVDPNDLGGNIMGGEKLLNQLMTRFHGNQELALRHYFGGDKGGADSDAAKKYASEVMARESTINLTVNVQGDVKDPDKLANTIVKKIEQSKKQETQRNLAEFQTPGWSY